MCSIIEIQKKTFGSFFDEKYRKGDLFNLLTISHLKER